MAENSHCARMGAPESAMEAQWPPALFADVPGERIA